MKSFSLFIAVLPLFGDDNQSGFVPFAGGVNSLEVELLYRPGAPSERIKKLRQAVSTVGE